MISSLRCVLIKLVVLTSYCSLIFVHGSDSSVRVDAGSGAPCPCVPDFVQFQFEFAWGCQHPPTASDFASSSSCSIKGSPAEYSIQKVIIQDLANQEELWLDVDVHEEETEQMEEETGTVVASMAKKYTFNYPRSKLSPTVLWVDFHQTSSASRPPVASIDLYYQRGSVDCSSDANPVYYAGDWIYFLTVTRVGGISDRYCRPYEAE